MYRAEVISVKDQVVRVMFIDYGNSEDKSLSELLMLPEELLVTVPYAAKLELDIAVKEDEEEKILVEGVVIKLGNENCKIVTNLIVNEDRMEGEHYEVKDPFAMEIRKLEAEDLLEKTKKKVDKENKKKGRKDLRKLIFIQHLVDTTMKIIKEIEQEEVELWGHLDC